MRSSRGVFALEGGAKAACVPANGRLSLVCAGATQFDGGTPSSKQNCWTRDSVLSVRNSSSPFMPAISRGPIAASRSSAHAAWWIRRQRRSATPGRRCGEQQAEETSICTAAYAPPVQPAPANGVTHEYTCGAPRPLPPAFVPFPCCQSDGMRKQASHGSTGNSCAVRLAEPPSQKVVKIRRTPNKSGSLSKKNKHEIFRIFRQERWKIRAGKKTEKHEERAALRIRPRQGRRLA